MLLKMQQVMSAQSRASIQMPELLESTNSIDTWIVCIHLDVNIERGKYSNPQALALDSSTLD